MLLGKQVKNVRNQAGIERHLLRGYDADTTTNANEIKETLVSFTKVVGADTVTGSYMMRNMRVGYADKDFNNYTYINKGLFFSKRRYM